MPRITQFRSLGPLIAAVFASVAALHGQTASKPYAAIDHAAVGYSGPGRDVGHDLAGPVVRIGLLAPLAGSRRSEGQALIEAAQLAIADEAANPLPEGRKLALATGDESGPWGRVSSEVVRLIYDAGSVAVITSTEGGSAHLAEQVGNKIGVPILTLSTDDTTTQINLPWIFRLGPSDSVQARLFAREIYIARRLKRVILVTENDHDGRLGGEEFSKTANEIAADQAGTPAVTRVVTSSPIERVTEFVLDLLAQKPEAIVFWTGADTPARVLPQLRQQAPNLPIFLCRKASQAFTKSTPAEPVEDRPKGILSGQKSRSKPSQSSPASDDGGVWVVASSGEDVSTRAAFDRRYTERTGSAPSLAVRQCYDAVRVIAGAVREGGANRVRLRDLLAEVSGYPGASGTISFDHAGNNISSHFLLAFPY